MFADLRFALRQLAKTPGFTAVALLTLALGIGANTAIFSVVKSVLLRPFPYPDSDRLVVLWEDELNYEQASIAWPDLVDWQRDNTAFTALAGYRRDDYAFTGRGEPEMLRGVRASASFFSVVGLPVTIGRVFTADEDKVGAPGLVVLSYGIWQRRFGGEANILGQTLTLNGEPYIVIGVAPPDLLTPTRTDFWTQLARGSDNPGWQNRGNHPGIRGLARIKPGFTFAQAIADLKNISAHIAKDFPDSSTGVAAGGQPLLDNTVGGYRAGLGLLLGAVALVLLIACANLASLLLARSAARETEFAVRAALGASRTRLVRQLLVESLVLALGGAALGLAFAAWARSGIVALSPPGVLRFQQIAIDGGVLAVTCALAIATAVLFGLWPAWKAAQPDLRASLANGGRGGSGGPGASRARETLIVAEIALTLVLLVGAGLLLRSFAQMQAANLGFEGRGVLTARVALPQKNYPNDEARLAFNTGVLERLATLPGVARADLANGTPLDNNWETSYHVPGTADAPPGQNPLAEMNVVSDGYFKTLGIPLRRGRTFGPEDTLTGPPVAIIDQALADRAWPGADPIGKQIELGGNKDKPATVVGVVPTLKVYGYATEPKLVQAYLSARQDVPQNYVLLIHATNDPAALTNAVRRAVLDVDPNQPIWDARTLGDRIGSTFATPRLYTFLLAIFAGLALGLAAVGIYGVLAYQVSRRTREFGIRLALGALASQVTALVLRRGLRLLALGLVLGFLGALALGKILGTLLYRTSAFDAGVLGGVAGLLATIALLACWIPARRAARVDPLVALRAD